MASALAAMESIAAWAEPRDALTMAEAAVMAVEASDDLRNAYAELEIRALSVRLESLSYLPSITFLAGTDERVSASSSDSFQKTLGMTVSETLWDWGRLARRRSTEAASLAVERMKLDRRARALGDRAVGLYCDVIAMRERQSIRVESIRSSELERAALASRVALGLATEYDLLEADAAIAEAAIGMASGELELAESELDLERALGIEALQRLSERLDASQPGLDLDGEAVARMAEESSASVAEARLAAAARRSEAELARLSWLPVLSAEATIQAGGERFPLSRLQCTVAVSVEFDSPGFGAAASGRGGREPPDAVTAGADCSLSPLASPGELLSARAAELAAAAALVGLESAREEARREAVARVERYSILLRRRDLALALVELARERRRMVERLVALGQAVGSDLVEAEIELSTRSIDLVDATAGCVKAEREIEASLGLAYGALRPEGPRSSGDADRRGSGP